MRARSGRGVGDCAGRGRCRRNRARSAQPTIGWMPAAGELLGEFERPEHVVGVGERQRRLLVGLGELGEPRDGQRAFEQRIGRMHVQMHEAGIGTWSACNVGGVIPVSRPRVGSACALKSTRVAADRTARYARFSHKPRDSADVMPGVLTQRLPGHDDADTRHADASQISRAPATRWRSCRRTARAKRVRRPLAARLET